MDLHLCTMYNQHYDQLILQAQTQQLPASPRPHSSKTGDKSKDSKDYNIKEEDDYGEEGIEENCDDSGKSKDRRSKDIHWDNRVVSVYCVISDC